MTKEPTTDPSPSTWSRLPHAWRVAFVAFFATRIPLVVFAWLMHHYRPLRLRAGHFLYHGGEPHSSWLVDAFQKWDAYWFLNIVREGYQYYGPVEQIRGVVAGQPETNVTPFPLYPLLMSLGDRLFGDAAVAGLIVSQVCLLLSLVLLYRLARFDGEPAFAELTVWLFAVVPWTYAFSAIYSESLFFALTVGAVLAVRQGRYFLAGFAGMLSAATRLPGVVIVVPLVLEHLLTRGWHRGGWRWLWFLLVPLGTLGYFGYLWELTGEPLAYFIGQQGWHKEFVGPFYHPIRWLTSGDLGAEAVLEMVVFVFVGTTLVLGFRRIRWADWVYALVSFLVLISSSYLLGLPRYCAVLYPLYLIWAGLGRRHLPLGRALLVGFAMLAPVVYWVWATWSYAF